MDGYAFCLGLDAFVHGSKTDTVLRSQVYAATSLIRGAFFRPRFEQHKPGRTSLNVFPLSELIDRYHMHEAAKHHDRVYALLGISSDNIDKSGLLPINYQMPWSELSCRLFQFLFGTEAVVESEGNGNLVYIYARGSVLGHVTGISRNAGGQQALRMSWSRGANDFPINAFRFYDEPFICHPTANPILKGDVVCVLKGVENPTIIRQRGDYFSIVCISVPRPSSLDLSMVFEQEFPIIWAWTPSLFERLGSQEISWGGMDKPLRMQAVALTLREAQVVDKAEEILLAAAVAGLSSPKTGTPSCFTEDKFIQITKTFSPVVVETLLRHKRGDFKITQRMMIGFARTCRPEMVAFALRELQEKTENIPLSEDLLLAALRNDSDEVLHLLLTFTWTNIEITSDVMAAARYGRKSAIRILLSQPRIVISFIKQLLLPTLRHFDPSVLVLLLDRVEGSVEVTEDVLVASLGQLSSGTDVTRLLLERAQNKVEVTSSVLTAAVENEDCGLQVTTLLLDYAGSDFEVTQSVLAASLENKNYALDLLKLLSARCGGNLEISETVLRKSIRSVNPLAAVTFLLDHYEKQVKITESILETVSALQPYGREIMELVFARRGKEIVITERILVAAVRTYESRNSVLKFLIAEKGEELEISTTTGLNVFVI